METIFPFKNYNTNMVDASKYDAYIGQCVKEEPNGT